MTLYEKLHWSRRSGRVVRFHAESWVGDRQTVYHHSASVALILIEVLGKDCSHNLLRAALNHDLEEHTTGDIPAPVKWATNGLIDALEMSVRKHYEIEDPELTLEEAHYLKAADLLDACFSCLDQRKMGNSFIDIVFDNLQEYIDATDRMIHPEFARLWRQLVEDYARVCKRPRESDPADTEGYWQSRRNS